MSKELLEKFGITEEVSADNLAEVEAKLLDVAKAKILEDESFYSTVDKSKLPVDWFKEQFNQGVSKISAMSKTAIDKHFGLTKDEKAKFTEDELKDVDKYVAKAAAIYKDKYSDKNTDVSAIQDENISLKQRLEEMDAQMVSLKEKFESDLNERVTAKEMETLSLIEGSSLQANVPVNLTLIWDKVYGGVKDKYSVVLEGGKVSLRKKDNPAFKVENPDVKGQYLDLKTALVNELKAAGAWKEEQKVDNKTTTVNITPGKGGNRSDAIARKIAEEAAFFG